MRRYLHELGDFYVVIGRDVKSGIADRLKRIGRDILGIITSAFEDCLWEFVVVLLSVMVTLLALICAPFVVLFRRIKNG